jgi:hypothetical protein
MIIGKKHLSRRALLRGAGAAAFALPLLDSMVPALAQTAAMRAMTPTRFTGAFVPHGGAPGWWEADASFGPTTEFPFVYKPLEPFREHVLLTSGMWSQSSENPPGVTGADHFVAAAYLCGVKPRKTTGADIHVGTSLDQAIAQQIGRDSLISSLQLAVEDPGANSTNCGEGYSCVYTNTISWAAADRPLPMEINPQVVFERMFGDGATPQERAARRSRQMSVLDSVTESLAGLRADVPAPDRVRLEQYFDDLREIERRLQIAAEASVDAPPDMAVPYGVPDSFDEHIKLQYDLLTLAYQADITRVASVLYARDLTGRVYPESGTNISFHGGSHHAEDPRRIGEYAKLNRYHVQMLAYFIDKLASTPDGDGTLLDHSLTLYGSNMGNSNQHQHFDVPHVLVGGAGGKLRGNRHLGFERKTVPTGNMLLSIANMYGLEAESFGDSTGPLPGI